MPKAAEAHALNVIAALEGKLFLDAVFGADGVGTLIAAKDAAE